MMEDLPDKPPITEPMPSDEELEQMDEPGEEEVLDKDFMSPEDAEQDDTADDSEDDTE